MPELDFEKHVDNSINVIIGIVSISLIGGISAYILYWLDNGTGNVASSWLHLLNNAQSMVNTVVTFLLVGVIAAVGFSLINYFRNRGQ